jgi:hypothetical protein
MTTYPRADLEAQSSILHLQTATNSVDFVIKVQAIRRVPVFSRENAMHSVKTFFVAITVSAALVAVPALAATTHGTTAVVSHPHSGMVSHGHGDLSHKAGTNIASHGGGMVKTH